MAKSIKIDFSQFDDFIKLVDKAANGDLKKELIRFLDEIGTEFLTIVQDEIQRLEVVDTRLLLSSFQKGAKDNIWILNESDMTLEVGTNVKYAAAVEYGHWTVPKGEKQRWIPGYWNGDKFVYSPGAKTGMLLKQKWIEGKKYMGSAVNIMSKLFPKYMEHRFNEWLKQYFRI